MVENWKYSMIIRDVEGDILEINQCTNIDGFKILFKYAMSYLRNEMHTGTLGTTIAFYRYTEKLFTLKHMGTDPEDGWDCESIEFQRPGDWYPTYLIDELRESFPWGKRC